MEKEKQKQERSALNSNSAESHVQNNNLRCPRCDSSNTKFCYYNNYNLTQPRHFCKTCRRYWTKGGALRNVPIGGGCRKNRKTKQKSTNKSQTILQNQNDGYQLVPSESGFSAPCSSSSLSFLWTTPMCGSSAKLHNLNMNSLQNHLIPIEKIPTLFDTLSFPTQTIMNPLSVHPFFSSSSPLGSELTMQALGCSDWNWRAHNHQQQEQERLQELSIATYNQEGEQISPTTSDNSFLVLCRGKSNIGLDNNFAGPQQTQQVIPQGVLELQNDALVLPQSASTGNYWQYNDRQPLM